MNSLSIVYREVVHSSECPLSEVPLYMVAIAIQEIFVDFVDFSVHFCSQYIDLLVIA